MAFTPFVPEPGKLLLRFMLSHSYNEVALQYRDKPEALDHYQELARMEDFRVLPNFSSGVDTSRGGGYTGAGLVIVFKYPSNNELAAFGRLWASEQVSLREWLRDVGRQKALDEAEQGRLGNQMNQFLEHKLP